MSESRAWADRLKKHRYSQDERALQWKFENAVRPQIDAFLDDNKVQSYNFGTYNLKEEPWRMAAAKSFRKFNLKIVERETEDGVEITLVKHKLSNTITC